jgi:hypothetical protein
MFISGGVFSRQIMNLREKLLQGTGAAALSLAALATPATAQISELPTPVEPRKPTVQAERPTYIQLGLGSNNAINSGYKPGVSFTGSVWNTSGPVGFHLEASGSNEKKIGAENGYTYRTRGGVTFSLGVVKLIGGVEWYGYRSRYSNSPDLAKHTNVPFGGFRIEPASGNVELELTYLPPDTTIYKLRSLVGTLDFKMYEWGRTSLRVVVRGAYSIAGGRREGAESGSFDGIVALRF